MAKSIAAPRTQIWNALTNPTEILRWDARAVSLIDAPEGHPVVGGIARWRYQQGSVAVELREKPLEVSLLGRYRASVSLGLFRFEEAYTLSDDGDAAATRLAVRIIADNALPVVGGVLDRFDVRRIASERVDAKLRALRSWCETAPRPAASSYV